MEVKLAGRQLPRGPSGDVKFKYLGTNMAGGPPMAGSEYVLDQFTADEVVELVNRALYQMEYQRESHKKRGAMERERNRKLKEALKAQGVDPKKAQIDKELKGE